MRPIVNTILCAFAAAGVAAPALAASTDFFLKLEGVDGESTKGKGSDNHKEQIEIASWSWGEAQSADALTDGLLILRNTQPATAAPTAPAPGGVRVAAGDVNGDGRADKFGAVGGAHRDDGIAAPRDSASGMPTGKRQHGWVRVSKALDRGAVRIKVKFPWLGCAVGARYPKLSLGGAQPYQLNDAIVTSCGSTTGGGRGLEEVSFNYAKIQVRGWDPATKKE